MKLVEGAYEDAVEILVNGVSKIERISADTIRMSFFSRRNDEKVDVIHLAWGQTEWRKFCKLLEDVRDLVLAEPPMSGEDDHPSRDMH